MLATCQQEELSLDHIPLYRRNLSGLFEKNNGDAGASVDNWLKIFERVAEMDVDKIIPGHGDG
jgi:hypothetical protein